LRYVALCPPQFNGSIISCERVSLADGVGDPHFWTMQFKIVGQHEHRAVVGGSTFLCVRHDTKTDNGLSITWTALRDNTVLKSDCRTLNEAKNVCRAAAAENSVSSGSG
jgi:hypothetical protein